MTEHYRPRRASSREMLTVRGVRHRVTRWGDRTRDPIVLLHGWMDNGATWQFLVDALPDSWSFAAPDWRGFGESEWPAGDYWFADYYADLEALLDELVPDEPARIIGHSMGGNIAMTYGGVRPARLAWLVNLEGLGLPRTRPEAAPERYAEWLDQVREPARFTRYASIEALATSLAGRNPRLGLAKAEFVARAWTRVGPDGLELAADPRHRRINPTLYRREELEACWRRLRVPLLLMLGERSELRSRLGSDASEEYLRAIVPHAQLVTVAGAGHMLHHEEPQLTAAHVVRFAQGTLDATNERASR
jgi:pimeloyl-ACP methyl ester carboxylesterase